MGGGDCPPCSDVALTADGRFAKISPNLYEGGGGGASLKTPIGFYRNTGSDGSGPSESVPTGLGPDCLIVGGNYNNSSRDGLSAWNSNNAVSNSNDNRGARLAYPSKTQYNEHDIPIGLDLATWQKIKKNHSRLFGRWGNGPQPKNRFEVHRSVRGVRL